MHRFTDRLWHQVFRRPYRAVCAVDTGSGTPVVLLHGLGSSSKVWSTVVSFLKKKHRVLAFDLLGFGTAPKPDWLAYTVDDHARAVIAALRKQKVREPVILVGHSMGCLVAVRVARLMPKLVDRLVLYEMPLYTEVPSLKRYTLLRRVYFAAYNRVLKHPNYSPANARMIQKVAAHLAGFAITKQTWTPYVRSLKNTIMEQTTAEDMKRLSIPMDLIYGSLDMVVLRDHVQAIFDLTAKGIKTHVVRSRHRITPGASAFIATCVDESIELPIKKTAITRRLGMTKLRQHNKSQQDEL